MTLRTAQRQKAKLRISISAPSGCGKTMGSLLLAYGITGDWTKIALIDSENWSGDLYSHLGAYNVRPIMAPFTPDEYSKAIHECEDAGMEVIIVDSITHVWRGKGGLLEYQEKLGGTFKDWAKVTPIYQDFIDVILNSPAHMITTIRKKTKHEMVTENGKSKVVKLGMDDEIRDGYEYEMTLAFSLSENMYASPSKDRTSLFKGQQEEMLTEETGKKLKAWAETGIDPEKFKKEQEEIRKKEELEWLKEQEEKEKKQQEEEKKKIASAEALYNNIIGLMAKVKTGPDLKKVWLDNMTNANLVILGTNYTNDLEDRKNEIKETFNTNPTTKNG